MARAQNATKTPYRGVDGERVRLMREKRGLTQTQLAYAIGSSQSKVSAIEANRIDAPSYRLVALAMVLAVSSDYLLGLVADPTPHGRT